MVADIIGWIVFRVTGTIADIGALQADSGVTRLRDVTLRMLRARPHALGA